MSSISKAAVLLTALFLVTTAIAEPPIPGGPRIPGDHDELRRLHIHVMKLEKEAQHLLDEVHAHHPNTSLDTRAHQLLDVVTEFHHHLDEGEDAHSLYDHHLGELRSAVVGVSNAAKEIKRPLGKWRLVWVSAVNPHVQLEINQVITTFSSVYHELERLTGHGHHHHH